MSDDRIWIRAAIDQLDAALTDMSSPETMDDLGSMADGRWPGMTPADQATAGRLRGCVGAIALEIAAFRARVVDDRSS